MRIWIDPAKAAARDLTAPEIVAALQAQNVQAAGGSIGQPPFPTNAAAFELPVQVEGRLSAPEEFGKVVLKTDAQGRVTRVSDIARIELGSEIYGVEGYFNGQRGVGIAVIQQPGSNALSTAEAVIAELDAIKAGFPPGVKYAIPYNPTEYVAASVSAVEQVLVLSLIHI